MKKLYEVIPKLLGYVKENPLQPYAYDSVLAIDFQLYFPDKIAKLRDELDNINVETSQSNDYQFRFGRLGCFLHQVPAIVRTRSL